MTSDTAPGRLELVRQFVNTRDIDDHIDEISSPRELERWVAAHDLGGGAATQSDVGRFADVREGLRALLLKNTGEPLDRDAVARMDAVAGSVPLSVTFGGDCELRPAGEGLDGALGTILSVVYASMRDKSFHRLKACREETCEWAFYDHSRNRSATWCSMKVCGNRAKARTYRARHGKGPRQG